MKDDVRKRQSVYVSVLRDWVDWVQRERVMDRVMLERDKVSDCMI